MGKNEFHLPRFRKQGKLFFQVFSLNGVVVTKGDVIGHALPPWVFSEVV